MGQTANAVHTVGSTTDDIVRNLSLVQGEIEVTAAGIDEDQLAVVAGRGPEMTRDEAYASCPTDSYVELYGHQWLIVPFAPVEQPRFFVCAPGLKSASY